MDFFKQISRLDAETEHRKAEVRIARSRGENYLACAKEALASGYSVRARVLAEEGLFLSSRCEYYVAVYEELQDFLLALPESAVKSAVKA